MRSTLEFIDMLKNCNFYGHKSEKCNLNFPWLMALDSNRKQKVGMSSMHREFYGYSHSEVRIKLENKFHRLMALDIPNWKQKSRNVKG